MGCSGFDGESGIKCDRVSDHSRRRFGGNKNKFSYPYPLDGQLDVVRLWN